MNAEEKRNLIQDKLNDWREPNRASIEHYASSGKVTGGLLIAIRELMEEYASSKWISVDDSPLYKDTPNGWECTEAGEQEFMAAIQVYNNKTKETYWWIRHCVVEDEIGLCIVVDDYNEPAGWELSQVEYYQPLPNPPKK